MGDRDELMALRRLAELEAKAGGGANPMPKDEPGILSNLGAGVASGFADLGDTIMNAYAKLPAAKALDSVARSVTERIHGQKVPTLQEVNADRHASLNDFNEGHKDSTAFTVGRVGGNIAATYPVGGALAAPLRAAAGVAGRAAPVVEGLANAVESGGFRGGNLGTVANVATRAAGGAITGGASAGLVNPDDAAMGAVVGGVLPPVLQGAGKVAGAAGRVVKSATVDKTGDMAERLAAYLGMPREELLSVLTQQGPQMIPGYKPTIPQIVQSPEASQLQRTLKTAGFNALGDADAVQQAQFREAINRVAPVAPTVNDAAHSAGSAIGNFAREARAKAGQEVSDAFHAVDPHDETALFLPIDEMKKAKDTFLGPGTFGTGSRANEAIATAERLGTETTDAIKPLSQKKIQDLVLAVRSEGGINTASKSGRELAGEIRNLRESGLNNIVRPNAGLSIERMAEKMHEAGFLPDNDPATLLNLLHESAAGSPVYAQGSDDAYRAMMEATQGPPPVAETLDKTVPFNYIQNLRSSIGEKAAEAEAKGANKEAAALKKMLGEIDSRINRAAGENVAEGEYFPKEVADRYRHALKLHADKVSQFDTGPQYAITRKGADGLPAIDGAEIPPKFYNGNGSQQADMQAFKRLVGNRDDLMAEMKRFAVTQGMDTASKSGNLTSSFVNWMRSRSGANKLLFNDQELATLKEVGKAVQRQMTAEDLGRVSGSDTAQKLNSLKSLGIWDSKGLDVVSHKVPYGRMALSAIRDRAAKNQNEVWARWLAEPEQFAAQLQDNASVAANAEALRGLIERLAQPVRGVARAAPVLLSDQ